MARLEIAVTDITRTGVALPASTAGQADGHKVQNDGRVFLHVTNNHATLERSVTVQTPGDVLGLGISELVVPIPANGGVRIIGPFPRHVFNRVNSVDMGMIYVDEDAAGPTDLALRVLRLL